MNKKLMVLFLLFLMGCDSRSQIYQGDPYEVLGNGKWDFESNEAFCKGQFHRLSFSEDKSEMLIAFYDEKSQLVQKNTYTILKYDGGILYMDLNGETRKDETGKLVSWALLVNNEKQYCWRRHDWGEACTGAFLKCK